MKDNIDTISKVYYTVNKPAYYIVNIVAITPFICIATLNTDVNSSLIMMLSIITYIILNSLLYFTCKKVKEKKGKLEVQKLSNGKKIWFIAKTLIVIFISVILASIASVLTILQNLGINF